MDFGIIPGVKETEKDLLAVPDLYRDETINLSEGLKPLKLRYWKRFGVADFLPVYGTAAEGIANQFDDLVQRLVIQANGERIRDDSNEGWTLFRMWQATRDKSGLAGPFLELSYKLDSLKSLVDYLQNIDIEVSKYAISSLALWCGEVQRRYNSVSRLRRFSPGVELNLNESQRNIDWQIWTEREAMLYCLVDSQVLEIAKDYAESQEIRKLISNREGGNKLLFHDTSSVGLAGIWEAGAIYSGSRVATEGRVWTGESVGSDFGHGNVHASSRGIHGGNASEVYFGDWVATLVIDEKMQEAKLREDIKLSKPDLDPENLDWRINKALRRLPPPMYLPSNFGDMGREEIRALVKRVRDHNKRADHHLYPQEYESFLGEVVPLDNVVAVAVPMEELEKWKNRLPRQKLLVREAAILANKILEKQETT